MTAEHIKVFISYSWDSDEHKDKVLKLANTLREDGVDCIIDRFISSPEEGWYRWMMDRVEESDFVLIICTEKYHSRYRNREEPGVGQGVTWEATHIIEQLYNFQGNNNKFIPVLLSPEGKNYIPNGLRSFTIYELFERDYHLDVRGGYQELYRRITNQPSVVPQKIGSRKLLQPIDAQLDPAIVEEYRQKASSLIYESYRRYRNISKECADNLETLKKNTPLPPEQAIAIDTEILQQCQKDYQRIEEYRKEAEQVIRSKSKLSGDVITSLTAKRVAYKVGEQAEAQLLSDVAFQLIQEGQIEQAEACLKRAIDLHNSIQANINPNIYRNLAFIRLKQGRHSEALNLLTEVKRLYEEQRFPDREVDTITDAIKAIEKKLST